MDTKKITLTNSFHNTEITIQVPANNDTQSEAWIDLQADAAGYGNPRDAKNAKAKLARVRRVLCGIRGCQCGTVRP